MSNINMESIIAKANKSVRSTKVKKKMNNIVAANAETIVTAAADRFIDVLQQEINSHALSDGLDYSKGGLGSAAIDSLTRLSHDKPHKVKDNRYQIQVCFDGDLSRESLAPDRYDGIKNIVALLNSGYTAGHRVYGVWKGHGDAKRSSLISRGGANFIENAVNSFKGNYANDYGVIDIVVNDIYK